jgi:predicted N-acetyltransferase YhbS
MEGPRFLRDGDFKSLSALLDICFRSKEAGEIADEWPHVCRKESEFYDRYLVYSDARRIVSCVAIVPMKLYVEGEILTVGGISIVGTHPDYRLRGLVRSLIGSSIELMKERGYAFAWLNGSRQLYDRFGWERAGRKYNFHFDSKSTAGFLPITTEIRRFMGEESLVASIMRIYNKREQRGVRDRDLTCMLLGRGRTETYISLANNRVQGYLSLNAGRGNAKNAEAYEYGGSSRAIQDLMSYCFDTMGVEHLSMASPVIPDRCRNAILDGASEWSIGFSGWIASGGMIKILDLAATLRAFIPQMERKRRDVGAVRPGKITLQLRESGETVNVDFGKTIELTSKPVDPVLSLGERALVRLLFGLDASQLPSELPAPLLAVLPLDFYISPLEMV